MHDIADCPTSKLSAAALALSAKITFKSQIFRFYISGNDTVGNMNLHKLFFHQAFNSYICAKKGTYNCYKSNKNPLARFF